jgi:hypothetical protein
MKEIILGLFAILVVYSCAKSKGKTENAVPLTSEQRTERVRQNELEGILLSCHDHVKNNPMPNGLSDDARIDGCMKAKLSE